MEQSEAIVLRIHPWSETSCVVSMYTREFGKLTLLAKGARRPKSPFEAALDLLSICRVVFIAKSSEALDILTEARLERRFRAGHRDLLRLNCGYYVAELLDRLTDKGDKQPEIFDLANQTLSDLQSTELEPRAIMLRFELQVLRMLGHLPSWKRCVQCGRDVVEVPQGQDIPFVAGTSSIEPITGETGQQVERWLMFSPISGGVLCEGCRLGARQLIRIHSTAQQTLIRFSESEWRDISVDQFTSEHRAAIRRVMVQYLTTMLDRQLNLHTYLEELGR